MGADSVYGLAKLAQQQRQELESKAEKGEEKAKEERILPLDLMGAFETTPPPLDFVLPSFLSGTVGMLASAGGVGKSMLTLESAFSIACGTDLFDLWGEDPHRGRVVYLAAEDTVPILHHRVHALGAGLDAETRVAVAELLDVMPVFGRGLAITPENKLWGRVTDFCDGARLVIVDTLNRSLGGLDENSNGDMSLLMGTLEKMCRETGAAALFLHHVGKAASRDGSAGAEQTAARGAGALTDNARWQANMQTMTAGEAEKRGIEDTAERKSWVRLELTKTNYGPPQAERWLRRGAGGVLVGDEPPAVQKKTNGRKKAQGGSMGTWDDEVLGQPVPGVYDD